MQQNRPQKKWEEPTDYTKNTLKKLIALIFMIKPTIFSNKNKYAFPFYEWDHTCKSDVWCMIKIN